MPLLPDRLLLVFGLLLQAAFIARTFGVYRKNAHMPDGWRLALKPVWLYGAFFGGACILVLGLIRSDVVLIAGQAAALCLHPLLPGARWKRVANPS